MCPEAQRPAGQAPTARELSAELAAHLTELATSHAQDATALTALAHQAAEGGVSTDLSGWLSDLAQRFQASRAELHTLAADFQAEGAGERGSPLRTTLDAHLSHGDAWLTQENVRRPRQRRKELIIVRGGERLAYNWTDGSKERGDHLPPGGRRALHRLLLEQGAWTPLSPQLGAAYDGQWLKLGPAGSDLFDFWLPLTLARQVAERLAEYGLGPDDSGSDGWRDARTETYLFTQYRPLRPDLRLGEVEFSGHGVSLRFSGADVEGQDEASADPAFQTDLTRESRRGLMEVLEQRGDDAGAAALAASGLEVRYDGQTLTLLALPLDHPDAPSIRMPMTPEQGRKLCAWMRTRI